MGLLRDLTAMQIAESAGVGEPWNLFAILIAVLAVVLAVLAVTLAVVVVREARAREETPYWLRNGLEDAMVPNVKMRVWLRSLRDFLDDAEVELGVQSDLIGQIRNGEYRKDQPATPRRRNGS